MNKQGLPLCYIVELTVNKTKLQLISIYLYDLIVRNLKLTTEQRLFIVWCFSSFHRARFWNKSVMVTMHFYLMFLLMPFSWKSSLFFSFSPSYEIKPNKVATIPVVSMESACIGIGDVSAASLADVWFHAQMDVHVVVVSKLVKESLDRAALITNVVLVFHPEIASRYAQYD